MSAKAMTMDEFLDHTGSDAGGSNVLKWREDGEIDVLLHPQAPFYSVWSHSWYVLGKDRETGKQEIFFSRFNSYEDEKEVLSKQRYRGGKDEFEVQYPWNKDAISYYGSRKFPPRICPFSLLLEWVREQIDHTNTIGWLDRIFDIDTDEGSESSQVIHAGGFTGLFGAKDLDDSEKVALKKAGIRRDESFKEDGKPRMQYVICVIPYKKPSEGPIVAIEAEALGKKFKKHIKDLRDDKRDPRQTPVVFRWKYDPDKDFSEKYDVAVRVNDPVGDDHLEALAKEYPAEKIDRIVSDSNLVVLRESFERWWCHKVVPPWDLIFKPAMDAYKGKPQASAPTDKDHDDVDEKPAPAAPAKETGAFEAPAPTTDEDDGLVACANPACEKPMKETDSVCSSCGATYAEDGTWTLPPPVEEKKPMRSRSAAAAGKSPSRGSKS